MCYGTIGTILLDFQLLLKTALVLLVLAQRKKHGVSKGLPLSFATLTTICVVGLPVDLMMQPQIKIVPIGD